MDMNETMPTQDEDAKFINWYSDQILHDFEAYFVEDQDFMLDHTVIAMTAAAKAAYYDIDLLEAFTQEVGEGEADTTAMAVYIGAKKIFYRYGDILGDPEL